MAKFCHKIRHEINRWNWWCKSKSSSEAWSDKKIICQNAVMHRKLNAFRSNRIKKWHQAEICYFSEYRSLSLGSQAILEILDTVICPSFVITTKNFAWKGKAHLTLFLFPESFSREEQGWSRVVRLCYRCIGSPQAKTVICWTNFTNFSRTWP